jgi:hypothetical protein
VADVRGPRRARNAERPGDYRLAIRSRDVEAEPGAEIHVELYMTGYGEIQGSKLAFYPPPYFIDEDRSVVISDVEKVPAKQKDHYIVRFGGQTQRLSDVTSSEAGLVWTWRGIKLDRWEDHTHYFDLSAFRDPPPAEPVNEIATEHKITHAPLELRLRVKENAPPGNHSLRFFLTYFNGSE